MKRATALCLAFALAALAAPAWSAETVRYVALVDGGKKAGRQVVEHGDDGVIRVDFVFKDNGRGPELKEEFVLAGDGTFQRYAVKGVSTFGAQVDERFERIGPTVRWVTDFDRGEAPAVVGAMYAPIGGTPYASAAALSAMAARKDGRLPLLPSGTLTARRLDQAEVRGPDGTRTVELLMVTGAGLTPSFLWMTRGPQPRLFAMILPGWLQLIEDGWQANANALEARQKAAETVALRELQQRLAHPLKGTTLVRNAHVFDSVQGRLLPARDVLLRDGTIVAVEPTGRIHGADRILDAGGRALLPGLIDMHTHVFNRWDGGLHIAAGVTTARDMGNDNATMQQLMADERAGTLLSPRLVAAGFLEGESPMSARNGFVIRTLDEAKQAIDWYVANGYRQLKIYNSFPKEMLRETVAYAHTKGLRVSGHVPVWLRAQDAVDAGYDEINHITQVVLNFLVKPDTDTRTLERAYLPARAFGDVDLDSKSVQDFIASLKANDVTIDPTVSTFDYMRNPHGQLAKAYAAIADHLPPAMQRSLRVAEINIPDDATARRYERSYDRMVEFIGRLHKAGVTIVAGTDALPGFTLHHELEEYVRAGMTPAEALQTATSTAARVAGTDDRGVVAPGKRADLILVDGDPTANIADIRKVALVIKGDVAYKPAEVHEALGIKPFAAPVALPGR